MSSHKIGKFARYRKIMRLFIRYGFEDIASHKKFRKFIPRWKKVIPQRKGRSVLSYSRYERIRLLMEELGPTYVKLGQLLSNRPDLLPEALIFELEKLQDDVPPIPDDELREILEAEYGKTINDIFKYIDMTPMASASIAQVHRAELLNGTPVVLKVQRPEIRYIIEADIKILHDISSILSNQYPEIAAIRPHDLLNSFDESIHKELDFDKEAANTERFARNFAGNEDIYVPRVFRDFTTEKILCLEYVETIKLSNVKKLRELRFDLLELANKGTHLYFKQVYDHGFFHADPHPGNMLATKTGKICFLDFGMMGLLTPEEQEQLQDIFIYIYEMDVKKVVNSIQRLSLNETIPNRSNFEREVYDFIQDYRGVALEDIKISDIIERIRVMLFKNKIIIPSHFYFLLRAMVIIEGVGQQLAPDYDIMKNLKPYAEELMVRKYNPLRWSRKFIGSFENAANLATDLPTDIKAIINKIKQGKLHIEFEHQGLQDFYYTLDKITNRISVAIVLAALIVGSALMVITRIPPLVFNIPLIGFIGFIISGILSIWLIISIMRKK